MTIRKRDMPAALTDPKRGIPASPYIYYPISHHGILWIQLKNAKRIYDPSNIGGWKMTFLLG